MPCAICENITLSELERQQDSTGRVIMGFCPHHYKTFMLERGLATFARCTTCKHWQINSTTVDCDCVCHAAFRVPK